MKRLKESLSVKAVARIQSKIEKARDFESSFSTSVSADFLDLEVCHLAKKQKRKISEETFHELLPQDFDLEVFDPSQFNKAGRSRFSFQDRADKPDLAEFTDLSVHQEFEEVIQSARNLVIIVREGKRRFIDLEKTQLFCSQLQKECDLRTELQNLGCKFELPYVHICELFFACNGNLTSLEKLLRGEPQALWSEFEDRAILTSEEGSFMREEVVKRKGKEAVEQRLTFLKYFAKGCKAL